MRSILFRRSAAILLAAALVTGYAPVGSIADGISHAVSISASADEVVEVTTWSGLQQAVNNAENGAVIKFADKITTETGEEYYWMVKAEATDTCITVPDGKNITIDLNNKYLDRGLSDSVAVEGGSVFKNLGTLTIKNGTLEYGNNIESGGGVYNEGILTLESVSVNNNSSQIYGGGIFNKGTLTLNSCGVCWNDAVSRGGGIYNDSGCTVTINSGNCNYNKSNDYGGGIYNDGELIISKVDNGSSAYIRDNTAANFGGVYNSENGTVEFKAGVHVNDNTEIGHNWWDEDVPNQNLYLHDGQAITVSGELDDCYAGITVSDPKTRVFTTGFAENNPDKNISDYFFADSVIKNWDVAANNDGEGAFAVNDWLALQDQINEIAGTETHTGTIKLEKDVVCNNNNLYCTYLTIPSNATITIDLNGHNIDRNLKSYKQLTGYVIRNEGTLTIDDTSTDHDGKITGGMNQINDGSNSEPVVGGIYNYSTLNIKNGIITGNKVGYAQSQYSAIYNETAGYYDENDNWCEGGAVTNMSGGVIKGNEASDGLSNSGGYAVNGINVSGNAQIYGNYYVSGEGDWVDNAETGDSEYVIVDPIYTARNVCDEVNVVGALTDGANIHVTPVSGVRTSGYADSGNTENPNKYFVPDNDNYEIVFSPDNKEAFVRFKSHNIVGAQLSLGSYIGVNFDLGLSEEDEVVAFFDWGEGKTYQTLVSGITSYSSDAGIAKLHLPAKEANDNITYRVYSKDTLKAIPYGDGDSSIKEYEVLDSSVALKSGTYNVAADYMAKILDESNTDYTAKDRQMAKAVANYCGEAQKYFGYNANNPMNEDINYTSSADITESFDDYKAEIDRYTPTFPKDYTDESGNVLISYYGTSLLLKDQPRLRHYFWVKDIDNPPVYRYNYYTYNDITQYKEGSHYFYVDSSPFEVDTFTDYYSSDYGVSLYDKEDKSSLLTEFRAAPGYFLMKWAEVDGSASALAESMYLLAKEAEIYNRYW